jgi:AbrB family transcriptional regulator, transcriptional pleiotropic regulator of transition state genes
MKATGIVREVDDLGRFCLPKELRRTLGIKEKDPLAVFVNGDQIILRKYAPGCTLCGKSESLTALYPDKPICSGCISMIVKNESKLMAEISRSV